MEQINYRQALIDKIGVPVQQGEVMTGPVKTTYLAAGSGAPIVCLHGAGAGAVTWYKTIAALAAHFQVIAPDIVGYGESDKPKAAYDRPYFAAWLCDFFGALRIPKAHLMGNSQGGAIGLQFALEHPERVEKLVLVDAGALGKGMPAGAFISMFMMNNFPSALAGRMMSHYLVYKPDHSDPDYVAYALQVAKKPGGNNVFMQGRGAAVAAMPEDELRRIQHETLIVWGDKDNFFPVAHGAFAAKTMPNATLHTIQAAGHLPFFDQPGEFNAALLQFLDAPGLAPAAGQGEAPIAPTLPVAPA